MRNKNCIRLLILSLLVLLSTANWGCKQASGINHEDTDIPIIYSAEVAKVEKEEGIEVVDAMLTPGSEITFQGYNIFQQEEMWDYPNYDRKYYTRMVEITITDSTIQDKSYFFDGQIIRPNYHDFPDKKGEYITATIRIQRPIREQGTFRGYVIDKVISLTPLKFDRKKILTACIATLEANTERLRKEIPEQIPKDWLKSDETFSEWYTTETVFKKTLEKHSTIYPDIMLDFKNQKAICRFASLHSIPAVIGFIVIYANVVFDLEHNLSSRIFVNIVLLKLE